jgi:hypothetical protein
VTLPPWLLLLAGGLAVVAAAVWAWISFGPSPSHDRGWIAEHSVKPEFEIEGNRVTVQGVRNFAWADSATFEPAWEERTYDLDALERVWFVLTPFSRTWRGPAHTLLSFQFGDSTFLAISVEARREVGESYGILKGMLRRFELIYVAGDERDLVGLRAVHRPDQVYVYPARVSPEGARLLFLEMAASANRLREHPEFYHSIRNNCTTRIVRHINGVAPRSIPRSWKVLLPGYSDALAHELGLLDTELPLQAARERWFVNERARHAFDAPDFSVRIRDEAPT